MSSCIAAVATNVFHIGNVMVKGIVVCSVAGSFAASLRLTNDCIVPVSNILALKIRGYELVSTRGHVTYSCCSIVVHQPSPLT